MKGQKIEYLPVLAWMVIFSFLIGCNHAHGGDGDQQDTISSVATKKPLPVDKFAWHPLAYDSSKKYIYLSFDDGPQKGTVTCYDICRNMSVKATFFMIGLHAAGKSDGGKIVSTIRENYPQILLANHSYTHANDRYLFFYHHPLMAEADFFKAQDSLHVPYKIIRLPGNSAWAGQGKMKATDLVRPVTRLLDSAGYNVIGWDVEWNFSHKNARPVQSAEKLAAEVDSAFAHNKTHTLNHLVILTHDRMFQRSDDADALTKFISILKHNPNYVFETVDHYPGVKIRQ